MKNKIKVGVVGVGKLGSYHIEKLKNNPKVDFIGIFDSNEHNMQEKGVRYKVSCFRNLDSLLCLCDAITVATPTVTHFDISKKALENNLHVFIEKPISNNLANALKIKEISDRMDRIVQVGHIERFNNAFIKSMEYIKKPQFIEIHRISPFPERSLDIPVVMDIMIHDLDIILSLNKNNPVVDIKAAGASIVTKFIDLANARIEFQNGIVANLTASRISSKQMRKIRIFQDNSYIGVDLLEKKIDFFEIDKNEGNAIKNKKIDFESTDALEDELNHFIDCINKKQKPIVSARDGIMALELGLEIEKLINNNTE